jgi:hypothetical protein
VVAQPVAGRQAFVTVQTFAVDASGPAKADQLCATEAATAGLSGTFKALLAMTSQSAISRVPFSLTGPNWVRLDGVPLAALPLALAAGQIDAPLNVSSARSYLATCGSPPEASCRRNH